MQFKLEKCAKATFIKGKLIPSADIHIDTGTRIRALDQEEAYKYLGVDESNGIKYSTMKDKIRKEY